MLSSSLKLLHFLPSFANAPLLSVDSVRVQCALRPQLVAFFLALQVAYLIHIGNATFRDLSLKGEERNRKNTNKLYRRERKRN